ncbi:hypothetical protein AB0C02_29395 [Micromonospora sp. NPDC048999]|uniref:hypothetical protein n=1 Tax=Micromonospora sp. NPDC048999 TaxID=3155391 RepID=UPI0033EB1972
MHRWLLLSYPRAYRRERGAEILETLQDIAPQHRGLRVGANLVRHGLRARLGRPASRSVVAWAAVFAVACGLFAASFGIWVAWLGSRPLDHHELAATVDQLYPGEPVRDIDRQDPPAVFIVYGSPLSWQSVPSLLFGDGGEYEFAGIGASFTRLPAVTRQKTLAQLQERLRAAGWDFGEPIYSNSYDCIPNDPRCDPTSIPSDITVYAQRGDNILEVHINSDSTTPLMSLGMSRATPWAAYPAGVLAFLLGTLGGWVLFGWASRRAERSHAVAQALAKFMFGFAVVLWWVSILLSVPHMLTHHLQEAHYRWHPLWEWIGQPVLSLPFLFAWVVLILAGGLIQLPRHRPVDRKVISP